VPLLFPDEYVHKHVVYITSSEICIDEEDNKLGLPDATFFTAPTADHFETVLLKGRISEDRLRNVQGFQDCGIVHLTLKDERSINDIGILLAERLERSTMDFESASESQTPGDEQQQVLGPVDDMASQAVLEKGADRSIRSVALHVYKVEMHSKYAQGITQSGSLNDFSLLFRWEKLHPSYGQLYGSWDIDVAKALEKGAYSAGRNLKVNILGASQEQRDQYFSGQILNFRLVH
jgi:hypothetical protein